MSNMELNERIETLKLLAKKQKITYEKLAEISNIPINTLKKIFSGKTANPRLDTVQAIESALGINEKSPSAERKGKLINVYGEIAAGIPIEAVEDILDQEEISLDMAAHGEYIALKVKGSSMEPRIMDGDVVIIRLQESVENNEIAAVFVNGDSVTLKRVKRENDGLWLIPNNTAYAPLYYSKKECAELPVRILGKLVEVRQKY